MDEDNAVRLSRVEVTVDALQKGHVEIMGALGELRGEMRAILPELRAGHADLAKWIESVRATYQPRDEVAALVGPLQEDQAQLAERVGALEPQVAQHAQRIAHLESESATEHEQAHEKALLERRLRWEWVPWVIAGGAVIVDLVTRLK